MPRALNQFLCKAINCAWTVRVKSHFKPLFTILVENGGYKQFGRSSCELRVERDGDAAKR